MLQIVKEIKEERRLTREDSLEFLLQEELEDLCKGADELRRYFKGQKANLCTIVSFAPSLPIMRQVRKFMIF